MLLQHDISAHYVIIIIANCGVVTGILIAFFLITRACVHDFVNFCFAIYQKNISIDCGIRDNEVGVSFGAS